MLLQHEEERERLSHKSTLKHNSNIKALHSIATAAANIKIKSLQSPKEH
jgi:hypothetical protein